MKDSARQRNARPATRQVGTTGSGAWDLLRKCFLSTWTLLVLLAACPSSAGPREPLIELPELTLDRFDPEVRAQLSDAHQEATRSMADRTSPPRERAELLGRLGRLCLAYQLEDAARVSFLNAHRLAPEETRWSYYLGALHQGRGESAAAEQYFRQVLDHQPDDLPCWVRLGTLQLEDGRLEEARRSFQRALELDGTAAAARFGLGRLAARQGDHQGAAEAFEEALRIQPGATQIHYSLAQSYRRLGDLEKARAHLARRGEAPATFPDPLFSGLAALTVGAPGHAYRGDQAILEERFRDAEREYRRAVSLAPGNYFYRKSLALTLYQLGQTDAAISAMSEAIVSVSPADPAVSPAEISLAHYTLGGMLTNKGSEEAALRHFQKALELDPANLDARMQLGRLAGRAGRLEEALEHFQSVLRVDPGHLEAVRFAATTNMDLGRFAEALPHLRRLVELEPDNSRNRWLLQIASEKARQE